MMNDCGNCRHTNHLGLPDWSTMPCAACVIYGADNDRTMWEAKPQTNYDCIIRKSPEELAEFMAQNDRGTVSDVGREVSRSLWLDWLMKEAEEGE